MANSLASSVQVAIASRGRRGSCSFGGTAHRGGRVDCDDSAGFMLEKCNGLGAISADHACGLERKGDPATD